LVLNKPKEPASTLRSSTDLASLIYKGKHAFITINISGHSQIMINSPEVCFGIARQHAQVGHKT
jgi:hypothetical protein